MVETYSHGKVSWVDIENPTDEEIETVARFHKLHHLVKGELKGPSNSSKAVLYDRYLYLVLQFPIRVRKDDHHVIVDHEIDFVIGRDFIITAHYRPIDPLRRLAKSMETNAILDKEKNDMKEEAGELFYYITRRMYDHMRGDIDTVNAELASTEDNIFSGKEKAMVEVISSLSRELLDFRQTCRAHYETLESLEKQSGAFFDKTFAPYVSDIKESFAAVRDAVVNGHELAIELRETNDSLLSTKQNETIKILTVVTSVIFPLSFISELFMMNTAHTPIVGLPYDFEIIVGIMLVVAISMFLYFKKKKWL